EVSPGIFVYKGELAQPKMSKYKSAKDNSMNPKQIEYYKFLLATYFKAQQLAPDDKQNGFKLPSVPKGLTDKLTQEGVGKASIDWWNNMWTNLSRDQEYQGNLDEDAVPVLYSQYMPKDEVSLD